MMLINPDRIKYFLHEHKDDFLREYERYLDKISEGHKSVKQKYADNPRVLTVVLSHFLNTHEQSLRLTPDDDRLEITHALIPTVKSWVHTYIQEQLDNDTLH